MARTRNESLQHILDELEAGGLGAMDGGRCVYENDKGNHCAIGCLFTPAQYSKIKSHNALGMSVATLVSCVGCLSLDEFAPGFEIDELSDLQRLHDAWAKFDAAESSTTKEDHLWWFKQTLKSMMI